jgi:hypothetical protein
MSQHRTQETTPASNWTGWISFGGMMLIIGGGFHVIEGLVTLLDDSYYLVSPEGLAVNVSYAVLGWIQLVLGLLSAAIGVGLLRGNLFARVGGVILAAASAIVHLTAMAAYPLWSISIIVVDILVIFSIVAHGREMKKLW